jgi:hypothetical protein
LGLLLTSCARALVLAKLNGTEAIAPAAAERWMNSRRVDRIDYSPVKWK